MSTDTSRVVTHAVDLVSAGAVLGALAGILPPIAAFIAIVWYLIQIYESATVQQLIHPHNPERRIVPKHKGSHAPQPEATVGGPE